MDLIPPSYESATDRDAWAIIAHYIPSSDLCAASLVCHRWHNLFMPFLWGDPASHFGTDNDAVYGMSIQNIYSRTIIIRFNTSGSDSFQKNPQICQTRSKSDDPYASSSTSSVRNIRWPPTGLVEGHPRTPAMPPMLDGFKAAIF